MPSLTAVQFEKQLSEFVQRLAGPRMRVTKTSGLFEEGILDSMKILDLIAFIESTLGIKVPDDKVVLQNFKSIHAITETFWKEKPEHGKK